MRVTLLGGGVGCSRLGVLLERALPEGALTIIVNTGDDHWRYGLRICPDLDTNMYALAGLSDRERGWGLRDDTFTTMRQLRELGDDAWFSLGNTDLATHMLRTAMLGEGASLSEVTAELARRLGLRTQLLPMSDIEVSTFMRTPSGEVGFQEWFVLGDARAPVEEVIYRGVEEAGAAPGALEAILGADLVVIGPSNPLSSIGPILAVRGVSDALRDRRGAGKATVAVTPVVTGVPISDPGEQRRARSRALQLRCLGLDHSASAVAGLYSELATAFVLDSADAPEAGAVAELGLEVVLAATLDRDGPGGERLASAVLGLGHPG